MPDRIVWIDRGWQPVAIGFCPSEDAWNREAKRLNFSMSYPKVPNGGGHTTRMVNDRSNDPIIIVCVFDGSERDALEVILTIVHEAVHVWQFLCQRIGETAPGIEVEAYGIEEITRGLIDAYCKTRGKGKDWFANS